MKFRFAWLADPEDADSYSARETRVLLRALARRQDIVALWFAVGSAEPPHFWNGIRVFPIPPESLETADFLRTLIAQQRPDVILSNLKRCAFPVGYELLQRDGITWLDRVSPADWSPIAQSDGPGSGSSRRKLVPASRNGEQPVVEMGFVVPYLHGLEASHRDGADATAVLMEILRMISDLRESAALAPPASPAIKHNGSLASKATHLVLRQQLFCNASLAHVMFELTNALIELRVPAVPQDEHAVLSKGYIHREEALFRSGACEKYQRVAAALEQDYDPEEAITIHFSMLRSARAARFGVFQSLGPRETLYTTGNHTVTSRDLGQMTDNFEMILAPSQHVLRPYLEAGLSRNRGAVIPHGIDPLVFCPQAPPLRYETTKGFKFLQTSFPWICEKGFDLSIRAFAAAFSDQDDVALILRVPHVVSAIDRERTFGRLEALVKEQTARPGAPEILLVEKDVPLDRRGGVYTGADCYVFPLRAEGFGMTILEAMGCGLPVIATPWSGPADFLSSRYTYTLRHSNLIPERTKNGTLLRYHVEPDFDHLVYLMRYAYQHQDEAKALGSLASAVAHSHWTWKHAAAKLASLFHVLPPSASSA